MSVVLQFCLAIAILLASLPGLVAPAVVPTSETSYTYQTGHTAQVQSAQSLAPNSDSRLIQVFHCTLTINFTYDANGNLVRRPGQVLTYSVENRLTAVLSGTQTTFVYDGDGNRVKQSNISGTTLYVGPHYEVFIPVPTPTPPPQPTPTPRPGFTYKVYFPLVMNCCYPIEGQQAQTTKYYFANGKRVAMRQGCSEQVTYFYQDHLGSTVAADGGQTARYYPYGNTHTGSVGTPYRYTGQQLDASTGLYYYGARYYDQALGRFIQADSIVPQAGNPQALNRYSYVNNNPLRYRDPTGHMIACGIAGEDCGGTEPPLPPPQQPDLAAQLVAQFIELYANGDYHAIIVNVNAGYPVMLAGVALGSVAPEVGVPTTLVGGVLTWLNWSGGVSVQWDNYGDIWVTAPNVSWGKTWAGIPLSVDTLSGYIQTGHNGPATQEEAQDFLTGPSSSVSAGVMIGGGATTSWFAENKIGTEVHFFTLPPQFGVMFFSWGFPLPIKYK